LNPRFEIPKKLLESKGVGFKIQKKLLECMGVGLKIQDSKKHFMNPRG
jgi:hypothetical protein